MAFIGKQITINGVIYTPLAADPSNPKEGQLFYSDGTARAEGLWVYKDTNWTQVGAGVSDKSVYAQFDAEDQSTTGFTNITTTSTSPINQDHSYSVDSYPATAPSVSLNDRNKNKENSLEFHYTLTSGTAKAVVKDQSANVLEEVELEAISESKKVVMSYYISSSITSLTLEFQDVSSATGLKFDDAIFSDDPFTYKNIQEENEFSAKINSAGTIISQSSNFIDSVTVLGTGRYRVTWVSGFFGAIPATTAEAVVINRSTSIESENVNEVIINRFISSTVTPEDGDFVIKAHRQAPDYKPVAEHVVTPQIIGDTMVRLHTNNGWGSTNTRIRRMSNIALGVGASFAAIGSTQSEGPITVTDSAANGTEITVNEPGFYSISYTDNAGANPADFGLSLNSTQLTTDIFNISADDRIAYEVTNGSDQTASMSWTGILKVGDVIRMHGDNSGAPASPARASFTISKVGFNSLSATPLQRVARIRDEKAAGTSGGSSTAGGNATRDLNTVYGDSAIVSLSSNQFTLFPGTYEIEFDAPAYNARQHRAYLYSVTDAAEVDGGLGSLEFADPAQTRSMGGVKVTLTQAKTYELRHYTRDADGIGLGIASTDGRASVFSQVKITKIN